MRYSISFISLILSLVTNISCEKSKTKQENLKTEDKTAIKNDLKPNSITKTKIKNQTTDFVPKSYAVFEKIFGDLDKDGHDDCILIIKGTEKSKFYHDEYRGILDRNRRGIVVLLNKNGNYELLTKNYDCFSSENEDGGVYYAPELNFEIKKGNLYINYSHGRYGYWSYTFRPQNNDLQLIGYDYSENHGPVVRSLTSINFLTRKKTFQENTNDLADSGEEVFEKTESKIPASSLLNLSEIRDFDELHFDL